VQVEALPPSSQRSALVSGRDAVHLRAGQCSALASLLAASRQSCHPLSDEGLLPRLALRLGSVRGFGSEHARLLSAAGPSGGTRCSCARPVPGLRPRHRRPCPFRKRYSSPPSRPLRARPPPGAEKRLSAQVRHGGAGCQRRSGLGLC
jgi:hypothetical protein